MFLYGVPDYGQGYNIAADSIYPQEQYRFIHDAILESIVCGKTQVNSGELRPTIEFMKKTDPVTEKTQFQTQFEV